MGAALTSCTLDRKPRTQPTTLRRVARDDQRSHPSCIDFYTHVQASPTGRYILLLVLSIYTTHCIFNYKSSAISIRKVYLFIFIKHPRFGFYFYVWFLQLDDLWCILGCVCYAEDWIDVHWLFLFGFSSYFETWCFLVYFGLRLLGWSYALVILDVFSFYFTTWCFWCIFGCLCYAEDVYVLHWLFLIELSYNVLISHNKNIIILIPCKVKLCAPKEKSATMIIQRRWHRARHGMNAGR